MKHPIFRNNDDRKMMVVHRDYGRDKFIETLSPSFAAAGQTENHCRAYVNRIGTLLEVEKYGCNLIKLRDAEHWNESMSEKTIKKMSVDDIYMPYPAFTIDLTNADWSKYEYVHAVKDREGLLFTFELAEKEGVKYHQMNLMLGKNVEDDINAILSISDLQELMDRTLGIKTTGMRDVVYKCISIIMFVSMFQKVTDKIEIVKSVNKGSKKRNMPNHNTSVTYLSQPTYKLLGKDNTGTRNSSNKTWMQKGHFKRQPYGKRSAPRYKSIWIDAMWKGSESKVLEKVIKV